MGNGQIIVVVVVVVPVLFLPLYYTNKREKKKVILSCILKITLTQHLLLVLCLTSYHRILKEKAIINR